MRIHTGEKPFICHLDGCRKAFKTSGHLNDHLKRHFNNKYNFKLLIFRTYECEFCSQKFYRKNLLNVHILSHNQNKVYQCSTENCLKQFFNLSRYRKHVKTHQEEALIAIFTQNTQEKVSMTTISDDLSEDERVIDDLITLRNINNNNFLNNKKEKDNEGNNNGGGVLDNSRRKLESTTSLPNEAFSTRTETEGYKKNTNSTFKHDDESINIAMGIVHFD